MFKTTLQNAMLDAFRKEMEGRQFSIDELFDALYWFSTGWQLREEISITITREELLKAARSDSVEDVNNAADATQVAGISTPRKGWSEERRKRQSERMKGNRNAKKKRASKAGQKAKG